MALTDQRDEVQFWRPRFIAGAELVSVAYRCRSFPEHSHAEYVIGAVTEGAETLTINGVSHHVAAGAVLQLHSEEAHANATVGPGTLRYNVLYLPLMEHGALPRRGSPPRLHCPRHKRSDDL